MAVRIGAAFVRATEGAALGEAALTLAVGAAEAAVAPAVVAARAAVASATGARRRVRGEAVIRPKLVVCRVGVV
ncbi:hypothetical protein GCM10009810_08440 [Nostocoides vanveenii]|uniref:Uncharacterized protein n=1 Tax=Nostocoides vanveenii TaxID=330835 RepID=A0ABP4WEB0_9MICO